MNLITSVFEEYINFLMKYTLTEKSELYRQIYESITLNNLVTDDFKIINDKKPLVSINDNLTKMTMNLRFIFKYIKHIYFNYVYKIMKIYDKRYALNPTNFNTTLVRFNNSYLLKPNELKLVEYEIDGFETNNTYTIVGKSTLNNLSSFDGYYAVKFDTNDNIIRIKLKTKSEFNVITITKYNEDDDVTVENSYGNNDVFIIDKSTEATIVIKSKHFTTGLIDINCYYAVFDYIGYLDYNISLDEEKDIKLDYAIHPETAVNINVYNGSNLYKKETNQHIINLKPNSVKIDNTTNYVLAGQSGVYYTTEYKPTIGYKKIFHYISDIDVIDVQYILPIEVFESFGTIGFKIIKRDDIEEITIQNQFAIITDDKTIYSFEPFNDYFVSNSSTDPLGYLPTRIDGSIYYYLVDLENIDEDFKSLLTTDSRILLNIKFKPRQINYYYTNIDVNTNAEILLQTERGYVEIFKVIDGKYSKIKTYTFSEKDKLLKYTLLKGKYIVRIYNPMIEILTINGDCEYYVYNEDAISTPTIKTLDNFDTLNAYYYNSEDKRYYFYKSKDIYQRILTMNQSQSVIRTGRIELINFNESVSLTKVNLFVAKPTNYKLKIKLLSNNKFASPIFNNITEV